MLTLGFVKLIIIVLKSCYCRETHNMQTFFCKNDKNDNQNKLWYLLFFNFEYQIEFM